MTTAEVVPIDEDIETVKIKVHSIEEKYYHTWKQDITVLYYENLWKIITIVHIVLDRKRSGDVAEEELSFHLNRKTDEIPLDVIKLLNCVQRDATSDVDIFRSRERSLFGANFVNKGHATEQWFNSFLYRTMKYVNHH